MTGLTRAQQRLLDLVQEKPGVFDARMRRPAERLEQLGLVTVKWDMGTTASGTVRWLVTVTAARREGRT